MRSASRRSEVLAGLRIANNVPSGPAPILSPRLFRCPFTLEVPPNWSVVESLELEAADGKQGVISESATPLDPGMDSETYARALVDDLRTQPGFREIAFEQVAVFGGELGWRCRCGWNAETVPVELTQIFHVHGDAGFNAGIPRVGGRFSRFLGGDNVDEQLALINADPLGA